MQPATWGVRLRSWLVGSDPGLVRLHTTIRTTVTLVVALVILSGLTTVTGGPMTVAMLGVVIAMQAAMAVTEPEPRQQLITMALLPLSASVALSTAALLAPHKIIGDAGFVLVIFVAVFVRRFGSRGSALGLVAFMSYFFALFLGAKVADIPKLVAAIVIGTACTLVVRLWLLPDRPERVLRYTVWSLWVRITAVIDISTSMLRAGRLDERTRQRLRRRIAQLNETVVMVEDQLEGGAAGLWPGIDDEALVLRLFDAELAVERVAAACVRAVAVDGETRARLAEALTELSAASSGPSDDDLRRATLAAESVLQHPAEPEAPEVRGVALAVLGMGAAVAEMRALVRGVDPAAPTGPEGGAAAVAVGHDGDDRDETDDSAAGMNPSTRQAIQVSIAATLAIIAGDMVSPARWYWAVITAFVVFAGTTSRGEILTRGSQQVLGTLLGVPVGVLVAVLVSGHHMVALVLILVCLFVGFYFQKVSYSVTMFCITTMLALLYGLMGQFSVGVLVLRIEETAVGAVLGIAVAALVLPTRTRVTATSDAVTFLRKLADVVDASVTGSDSPTELARTLHRQLHRVRVSAKPLTAGIFGMGGHGGVQRSVRLLTVCDHHARILARAADGGAAVPADLAEVFDGAATSIRRNIDALLADASEPIVAALESLDAAEGLVNGPQQVRTLNALRAIDGAVLNLALELGLPLAA